MPALSDILQFARGQLFQTPELPATTFAGQTIVVIGANIGLGYECAQHLINLQVKKLILGCRSFVKGEDAKRRLLDSDKGQTDIQIWQIDMQDFASVRAFGRRLHELDHLHAVIANAGISTNEYQEATGYESTLTVNVISTFLLAQLALPKLAATADMDDIHTHITIVGSSIHAFADHRQVEGLPRGKIFETLSHRAQADMKARYFISKMMVMLCLREMSDRIRPSKTHDVVVNCPNPGWCKTELFRQDDGGFWGRNMLRLIGRTSEVGARTLTSAIAAVPQTHGRYLSECSVKHASRYAESAKGEVLQRDLWEELQGILVKLGAQLPTVRE